MYIRSGLIYENANIHIWMKCTDVDVFLAGRGGPNSLLWQYLALPSGDENYFADSAGGVATSQAGRPTQL